MPSPPPPPSPAPKGKTGPLLSFTSADLNVSLRGRVVSQPDEGKLEGVVLELDESGVEIKHPQLLSISTKPESQTLYSINTGERLLTLSTPLLPPSQPSTPGEEREGDVFDDDDEDDDDVSPIRGPDKTIKEQKEEPKRKPTLVTLHEALLPFSSTAEIQASPLFSTTYQILISGPSFPPPHFDPSSIVPPTPSVKPYTYDPSNPPTSASHAAFAGGVLNSPTLQRALLSPLLSPQRRATSQSSDASVPPLNLGLSRTQRSSFSGGDRGAISSNLRNSLTASPSSATQRSHGLIALLPSLAPPAPDAPSLLASQLSTSLSTAAKKTAEELLALRRAHDLFVRRARAELEVLETRIEEFRRRGGGEGEGVVRGFRTKEEGEKEGRGEDDVDELKLDDDEAEGEKHESEEEEEETSPARGRAGARRDEPKSKPPLPSAAAAATTPVVGPSAAEERRSLSRGSQDRGRGRTGPRPTPTTTADAPPSSSSTSSVLKATTLDESLSSKIREADEREEDERGRSRSRIRRGSAAPADEERRSRSRTKGVAEATRKAVEGAREKSASRERGPEGREESAGRNGSGGRAGGPRVGESIRATIEEEDEEEEEEENSQKSGLLSTPQPSSGTTSQSVSPPPSSAAASSSSASTSTSTSTPAPASVPSPAPASAPATAPVAATPTFIPSSSALIPVPEEEELSLPRSREETPAGSRAASRGRVPKEKGKEKVREKKDEREEDADQPFEMDEDVDVDNLDISTSTSREPLRSQPATLYLEGDSTSGTTKKQQQPSSSYKPGSFQRASALSASYAALLNPSRSSPSAAALSPSISTVHSFGSPAHSRPKDRDGPGPFSPPEAKSATSTSAREDAQDALAASIYERTKGAQPTASSGPDPRDVRRGEQKIRDVLAMDVPSHRPLQGRNARNGGAAGTKTSTYTPDANSTDEEDDSDAEEDDPAAADEKKDRVDDLTSSTTSIRPPRADASSKMHVGSLPIALGRPSTFNAALSSWRPDPERLWAAEREKELRKGNAGTAQVGFAIPPASSTAAGGGARGGGGGVGAGGKVVVGTAPSQGWTGSTTQPLSIGSGARNGGGGGGGGGAASSLAQSLRAAPASFSARAEAEHRFTHSRGAAQRTGRGEPEGMDALESPVREEDEGENGEGGSGEEDEDDEGEFVPPHLVEARRKRKDEEWLSRSVSQS